MYLQGCRAAHGTGPVNRQQITIMLRPTGSGVGGRQSFSAQFWTLVNMADNAHHMQAEWKAPTPDAEEVTQKVRFKCMNHSCSGRVGGWSEAWRALRTILDEACVQKRSQLQPLHLVFPPIPYPGRIPVLECVRSLDVSRPGHPGRRESLLLLFMVAFPLVVAELSCTAADRSQLFDAVLWICFPFRCNMKEWAASKGLS